MGLTMRERQAVTRTVALRYRGATKKKKGMILNEFIELTGYTRCYARLVLRQASKDGGSSRTRSAPAQRGVSVKRRRQRGKLYDERVVGPLTEIWYILDCLCGKRLAPALQEVIPVLERYQELKVEPEVRHKLLRISPATIDRLLAKERARLTLKGRAGTKPGTLLKHQIPIRTFAEWNEKKPGFVEIDLVGHDGGNPGGEFMQTLDVTDVCTGWTDIQAVKNKAQRWVFQALQEISRRVPFDLLGIDSDNGTEFINNHLLRFCQANQMTFTRGRSYKKNDSCFVEQKNYSVVRRAVGYCRHETDEELKLMNELYQQLRLYINYFQPVMKLKKKTRVGSRVKKTYDRPRTPYHRVLRSSEVTLEKKQELKGQYEKLNPAELKRKMTRLQQQLFQFASHRERLTRTRVSPPPRNGNRRVKQACYS